MFPDSVNNYKPQSNPSNNSTDQSLVVNSEAEDSKISSLSEKTFSEMMPESESNNPEMAKVFRSMKASNVFGSFEERDTAVRMAEVAKLMYNDIETKLAAVSELFPHTLVALPSPQKLGMKLPNGLVIQAFRHHEQIIIAIRGTELKKDKSTLIQNLIADLGIGRHKSNEDLETSLNMIRDRVSAVYGFTIDDQMMKIALDIISSRVLGHNDTSRTYNIGQRALSAFGRGAAKSGIPTTIVTGLLTGGATLLGAASAPVSITLALGVGLSAGALGGGTSALIETVKCGSAMDGYPTLLSYVQAIDTYIMSLKETSDGRSYITDKDEVITVGHSLGGYLAGVIGAMHADEIFAFNGPGVLFDTEMKELIANLGLERKVNEDVIYRSISMEADFIGNLGERQGGMQKLYLPLTSPESHGNFPSSAYTSPLAHHGIDLIAEVLKNSTIITFPKTPASRQLMLTGSEGPIIEIIEEDEEDFSK